MSASSTPISETADLLSRSGARSTRREETWLMKCLVELASLKLTVGLFACSIVLVLIGTLAQVEMNMWEVMRDYFRCFVAIVPLRVFFPVTFFGGAAWVQNIPGWFPFPGGFTLGIGLALNLLAAHLYRFRTQAKGTRLWSGWAVIGVGVVLTTLIVMGGHNSDGLQGTPWLSWDALWNLMRLGLVAGWVGSVALLVTMDRSRRFSFYGLLAVSVLVGLLSLFLVLRGDTMRLGDSSLRILWQLIQGGLAALVLLVGCVMVFKKRAGIVVIHLGVALVMFNELLVGLTAVEERMTLLEGESTSIARDIRSVELAVIDRSPADHDRVVVVPGSRLSVGKTISDELLPFDIEVVEFLKNSNVRKVTAGDVNLATTGLGTQWIADPVRSTGGAEVSQAVDLASAYVRVVPKEGSGEVQTHLLAQHFGDTEVLMGGTPSRPEPVSADGKSYEMLLRYKQTRKPYELTLNDIRKDDYLGTNTPRDYSSWVALRDPSRHFERDRIRIWMNNPLRYAGETFYQSGYAALPDGQEVSTLQIVTNTGWMVPYIACMFVAIGMLYHFSHTLMRFLRRTLEADGSGASPVLISDRPVPGRRPFSRAKAPASALNWVVPLVVVSLCGLYVATKAMPRPYEYEGMRLGEFGKLPVVYGGRVKPLDTLARNALRTVSDKQTLSVPQKNDGDYSRVKKEPAIRWLLNVITRNEEASRQRMFRIPNLDVLATLGLERRKGFLYSVEEVGENIDEFDRQVSEARRLADADPAELNFYQKKLLETDRRLRAYTHLQSAFMPIPFPAIPSREEMEADPSLADKTRQEIARLAAATPRLNASLMAMQPPLVVPTTGDDRSWLPFAAAANDAFTKQILAGERPDRRLIRWSEMIDAYARKDATNFNRALAAYRQDLQSNPPSDYSATKVNFEEFFNEFQPFTIAMVLYILAFALTAASWIGCFEPLRRTSLWLVLLAFVIHTLALIARIYISGRPPVTNLYSSAVFVGWGAALFGIVIELLFRMGVGNVLSTVIGFATLIIAHNLAYGGDTFTVLQAVLDTQFWLATHVVCVTFGYLTTFVAGAAGVVYILAGLTTRSMSGDPGKAMARIVYGTVCFAIFFSFVGTVLGGLWADDSWGRFWGWDPKENGALMIVLWNALILHARWGGLVKDRGLCVLAVGGNIVTAWSWFGVNELGVGLHSYGFTKGVLQNLAIFWAIQLAIVMAGCLPLRWWLSFRPAKVT